MYSLIVILIGLFLTSCTTTHSYDKIMTQWQGKPVSQLVRQAGQPTIQAPAGSGNTYYGYITSSGEFYPPGSTAGATMALSEGKPAIVQGRGDFPYAENYGLKCTTIFTVNQNQIIVGARSKGSCVVVPKLMPPNQ